MNWTTTGMKPAFAGSTLPVDQGVMDVLSASMYADGPVFEPDPTANKVMYGGLLLEESNAETETLVQRPKKKAKTSKNGATSSNEGSDDGAKRHRGRPRIEPQDETAVDRRRTQIRLAQRAYRNRKENTITNLKDKNKELEKSIGRMNQTFSMLCDKLAQYPEVAVKTGISKYVDSLKQDFDQLAEYRSVVASGDEDDTPVLLDNKRRRSTTKKQKPQTEQESVTSNTLESSPTNDSQNDLTAPWQLNNQSLIKVGAGPQSWIDDEFNGFNIDATWTHPFNFEWDSNFQPDHTNYGMDFPDLNNTWNSGALNVERSFSQRKAYTYSFQETSFARRLHRMCLERAFQTLTNPKMNPAWVARTFRFTLFYMNKRRLRASLGEILQRKAGDKLENMDLPYFQVGGAGTHFPRRDAMGAPVFPPNLQSPVKAPGPWQLVGDGEEIDPEGVQRMLDEMGLDGIWFDSHDVEGYLNTKGIYLNSSSSFVEIDASILPHSSETGLFSKTNGTASNIVTAPSTPQSLPKDHMGTTDFDPSNHWSTGIPPNPGALPSPGAIPTFEQVLQRRKGIVTFDVEKFLSRIVDGGCCLGRAPGFRKDTVDSALALAVQEAF